VGLQVDRLRFAMRTHGSISKWNEDRGFGFISPAGGGAELFVHVSAFPRDGRRPTVGEVVSYETETTGDGKVRAVKVMRRGQQSRNRSLPRGHGDATSPRVVESIVVVLLLGGILGYAYTRMRKPEIPTLPPAQMTEAQKIRASFACENLKTCAQMNSCQEARDYLQTCPKAPMDGDADGIPCEDKLCRVEAD